jgi:hypothetical protein
VILSKATVIVSPWSVVTNSRGSCAAAGLAGASELFNPDTDVAIDGAMSDVPGVAGPPAVQPASRTTPAIIDLMATSDE